MKTNTTTAAKLLEVSRQLGLSLPEVMLRRERELNETPPEVVYEKLRVAYGIMRQAVEESLKEPHKTMGGLIGGEARKLAEERAEAERKKLADDLAYYEGFLASVMKKLSNERFVASAPEKVVANERAKQADAEAKITAIREQLAALESGK